MPGIRTFQPSISSPLTSLIFLALAWFYLAPVQVGGRTVYLIIDGTSMQPTFYTGDLVILHQTDRYEIGDAAAYRVPSGGIIIHRIIAQEGNRFTLLGDNKPGPDLYRPLLSEMVGKYWLHIPDLGKLVSRPRQTGQSLAIPHLLLIGLGFLALIPRTKKPSKRPHFKSKKEQPGFMTQFIQNKTNKSDLLLFLLVLVVISATLAYLGFRQPLTRTLDKKLSYIQKGTFNYTAPAPPGIYRADIVQTGEPIFRALINQVIVHFDYEFESKEPAANLIGTREVIAKIAHENGWNTRFELVPKMPFSGDKFSLSTTIDLAEVQSVVDNLKQQTGLNSGAYTLTIVPIVTISGMLNQQVVEDDFSPWLTFDFDAVQMTLAESKSAMSGNSAGKQLEPSQAGNVTLVQEVPNIFSIYRFQIPITLMRYTGLSGLIISLSGLTVLGAAMLRASQADEATRIQFKYGGRLTLIRASNFSENDRVEMATIDDLIQLGERQGCPLLYYVRGSTHHYLVKDGFTTYHYQALSQKADHGQNAPQPILAEPSQSEKGLLR